jgi:Holliday junction resolvase
VSTATVGRRVEHQVRDDLSQAGWVIAARAAGSKGAADLVAFKPGQVVLCQCKRSNPLLTPAERVALIHLADVLGLTIALPIVASKPPRTPITYRLLTGPGPKDWQPWTPQGDA